MTATLESSKMQCYLFDIDGTIADLTHRLPHIQKSPKDWDAFFAACEGDAPIPHIIQLARDLSKQATVIFVSGRSDRVRAQTEQWITKHVWSEDRPHKSPLVMRKDGDHRPDNIVKAELLDTILECGWQPIMAFDDRDQVVKMWRERGVPCAQVAEGAF